MSTDNAAEPAPSVPSLQSWRKIFAMGANHKEGMRLSQEACADIVAAIDIHDAEKPVAGDAP